MEEIRGTSNRGLEVDLSLGEIRPFAVSEEDRRLYLGGKGLGLKLLYDRLAPGVDPLGEENVLAFMTGVFPGTGAPCSARFAAVTKSPLTGLLAASSCGGPFGTALKTAGWDALLIRGRSERPVRLVVDREGGRIEDGESLWGLDTVETQAALGLGKKDGALAIGPAGEHRVLFANVASGHRFFGRGGVGAVMGAKGLKAIQARGGAFRIVPRDPELFERMRKRATAYINRNPFTSRAYRRYGTASNLRYCTGGGILPVRNFQAGDDPEADRLSGEAMQERYRSRPSTCRPCTILCGHKGTFPDGSSRQIAEYETVALLGANLGVFDPDRVSDWNELCGRLGMDTISAGGTIAFAMEAGERGLMKTDLRFGSPEGVDEALKAIAYREGPGDELADGVRRLSGRYGGDAFAIHVKGMEVAGYDPRGSWGQGLAYAVANRGGCHLSATLFPLEVFFGLLRPRTVRAKAEFVRFLESLYAAVNSLQTCLFTAYAYMLEPPASRLTPKPLLGLTMQYLPGLALRLMDVTTFNRLYEAITGLPLSQAEMIRAGDRIHTLERWMNTREGVSRKDDTLPARFLLEDDPEDPRRRAVPLDPMLDRYYRIRGFDPEGVPTPEALEALGIPESDPLEEAGQADR